MPMVCFTNRQASSLAHTWGQAQIVCAILLVARWGLDCLGGALRSFEFLCASEWHQASCSHCQALPHQPSQCFPLHKQGNVLSKWVRGNNAMPSHHPAPSVPRRLAPVAMFHLTSPKEFTFLFASPPLPLSEPLSLEERERHE